MTTSDRLKQEHPVDVYLTGKGIKLQGIGDQKSCRCPFHQDKQASMSINTTKGLWHCHAGCGGGSVLDLMARFENVTVADILKRHGEPSHFAKPTAPRENAPNAEIDRVYPYHNERGDEVYQVVRLKPKSFRQRHQVDGKWVWNMENVRRVLYRLPHVLIAQEVWICEGEKDADTLVSLGFTATCNVGGAGKWLDGYTESLSGKMVVMCGDNDEPGQKHVKTVLEMLAGHVNGTRTVRVPAPHKDVTDWVEALRDNDRAKVELLKLRDESPCMVRGIDLPIYSMQEIEERYIEHVRNLEKSALNLSNWLPSLQRQMRAMLPGEVIVFVADTGVGKTALLSNLAYHAAPLPTLFFELELPDTLLFERVMSMRMGMSGPTLEDTYRRAIMFGQRLSEDEFSRVKHIQVCSRSKLTVEEIARLTNAAELKTGQRPKLVLIDYIQLVQAKGASRYERISTVAEDLKVFAKEANVVLAIATQIHRKGDSGSAEIGLHEAKDSGSIENSAGLVLGAWRDQKEAGVLWLKILKNTKGQSGHCIKCNFVGQTMTITEQARKMDREDVPED
jgi:5S rRNA maturation endonuclease (ribonuclease M5)